MIIGAAKGGTTDLYSQLTTRSVIMDRKRVDPPLVSKRKEIRFLHLLPFKTPLACPSTLVTYLSMIDHPCKSALAAIPRNVDGGAKPSPGAALGAASGPGVAGPGKEAGRDGGDPDAEAAGQAEAEGAEQVEVGDEGGGGDAGDAEADEQGPNSAAAGQAGLEADQPGEEDSSEEEPGEDSALAADPDPDAVSAEELEARDADADSAVEQLGRRRRLAAANRLSPDLVCMRRPRPNPQARNRKYIPIPVQIPVEQVKLEQRALDSCRANRSRFYTIDASPMYMMAPNVPKHLASVSPNTKIILLLRDPLVTVASLYHHRMVTVPGVWGPQDLNSLVNTFWWFVFGDPQRSAAFHKLAKCKGVRCQEDNWRVLIRRGINAETGLALFANSLYVYSLAAWRRNYFRPGRVMVIDSHAYYRDREAVMEKVVLYLYGRNMTNEERLQARQAKVKNAKERPKGAQPWVLNGKQKSRLAGIMNTHVVFKMKRMLQEMREEGAWVVGFDGAPWPWATKGRAKK